MSEAREVLFLYLNYIVNALSREFKRNDISVWRNVRGLCLELFAHNQYVSNSRGSVYLPARGGPQAIMIDRQNSHNPKARAFCRSCTEVNTNTFATVDCPPSNKPNAMK